MDYFVGMNNNELYPKECFNGIGRESLNVKQSMFMIIFNVYASKIESLHFLKADSNKFTIDTSKKCDALLDFLLKNRFLNKFKNLPKSWINNYLRWFFSRLPNNSEIINWMYFILEDIVSSILESYVSLNVDKFSENEDFSYFQFNIIDKTSQDNFVDFFKKIKKEFASISNENKEIKKSLSNLSNFLKNDFSRVIFLANKINDGIFSSIDLKSIDEHKTLFTMGMKELIKSFPEKVKKCYHFSKGVKYLSSGVIKYISEIKKSN